MYEKVSNSLGRFKDLSASISPPKALKVCVQVLLHLTPEVIMKVPFFIFIFLKYVIIQFFSPVSYNSVTGLLLLRKHILQISLFHRAFPFTMCNGPTNALVCNKTLIQMPHIKTLNA
jgi:hypothetical protein